MKSRTLTGFLLAAVATGCAPEAPAAPPPPDAAAIQADLLAQLQKFGPAFEARDPAAVAALFTEDATWILPDASTFRGRAEIEQGAAGFFAAVDSAGAVVPVIDKLVVISDTEALTFAHATMSMKMKGAKKSENHNNPYADYWQKGADGVWRVAYEVNADGVVPDPAAPKP